MLPYNYHTHTARCNHADGTDREYVEAAIQAGVKELGFSDHAPYLFPNTNYYSAFRMKTDELFAYAESVRALQKEYADDIRILLGFELEYYPAFHKEDNLVILAHPFRDLTMLPPEVDVDGAEVFNMHPGHNNRPARAAKYARKNGLLVTCGSDFHHPQLPGNAGGAAMRTRILPRDGKELVAILKSRDYLFEIGSSMILPYAYES